MNRTLSRMASLVCPRHSCHQVRFQTTAANSTPIVPIAATPLPLPQGPETTEVDVESDERIEKQAIEPHPRPVNILKNRIFEFYPPRLKLRTWLPDELYSIIEQYPTKIPSSLPGIHPEQEDDRWYQLPPPPSACKDRETFLEDERKQSPLQLMHRFYACGGFWLCHDVYIAHFLQSFWSSELSSMVPFLRRVISIKYSHKVPRLPRQEMSWKSRSRQARSPTDAALVYNELFRALASEGRDLEFLSLWNEAKTSPRDLKVGLNWHSYTHLFRCFRNSPRNRVKEGLQMFQEYKKDNLESNRYNRAIVSNALLSLILRRVTSRDLDDILTFDKLLDTSMHLLKWSLYRRVSNYTETLSPTQLRIVVYFRLCKRLNLPLKAIEFYDKAKQQGIEFTSMMYSFAFLGGSSDPRIVRFGHRVLGDMVSDSIPIDPELSRSLLRGRSNAIEDISTAISAFKLIESANQVDASAITLLLRKLVLVGELEKPYLIYKTHHAGSHSVLLERNVTEIARVQHSGNRIEHATSLPSPPVSAMSFPDYITVCITTVWYLVRRYEQHFTSPQVFNAYLSFAVNWRFDSVEAIFRDCFDHFDIPLEYLNWLEAKRREGGRKRFKMRSRRPWHWPLPVPDSSTVPYLPEQKPRPDKSTFVLAMEFAHYRRLPEFAREVWARRYAWREQIHLEALREMEASRWDTTRDEDIIRAEFAVTRSKALGFTEAEWAGLSATENETSDGASERLYEGYVRLLYIQTLAAVQEFDEALQVIRDGTGERYPWTQKILAKVRKHAEIHGHQELCEHIDGLDHTLDEGIEESPEKWWEQTS